jgi:MFS family permease
MNSAAATGCSLTGRLGCSNERFMRHVAAAVLVFVGGFAIMVLEIIGARYLAARGFGSSFYVWVSQIGVVLAALALGYYVGGALADRYQRMGALAWLLIPAGLVTFSIPEFTPQLVDALIGRHPPDQPIARLWQKLDPALASAAVFLLPCFALATLSPCLVRLASAGLTQVGRVSGLIYAAGTVGSLAGVFVSGYVLIDHLTLPAIFQTVGVVTGLLGGLCWWWDRWFGPMPEAATP